MTLKEARALADHLAKTAIVYIPLCAVITMVVIMCVAAQTSYIGAGMVITTLASCVLLVLACIPSWFLEHLDKFLESMDRQINPPTKSQVVKEFARREGLPIIDIKLYQMPASDMKGLPE
jgi:hypothetical protein